MISLLLAATVMGLCNDCSYNEQIIAGWEQQLQEVEQTKATAESTLFIVEVQIRVTDLTIVELLQTPVSDRDASWEDTFYGVVSHRNNLSDGKNQLQATIGSAEYAIADIEGMIEEQQRLISECGCGH